MAKRKSFSINQSLSKGLEETITAAHDFSGELLVEVIPVDRLELDPENPRELHLSFDEVRYGIAADDSDMERKQRELTSLHSLSHSIKDQGLINPIVVYKDASAYRLVAGERRTLASLLAGKQRVAARILPEKPNPLNRFILQWAENIEREDLTLWERISNIRSIVAAYATEQNKLPAKVTAAQTSELIGISSSQSAQYKLVLQADEGLLSAIQLNHVSNLDKAAFIAKAIPSQQEVLISLCAQGATLKELKAALSTVAVQVSQENRAKEVEFSVTIRSEQAAKTIINSLLSNEKFAELSDSAYDDSTLTGKALTKRFNQLLKKLEETTSPHEEN
jgi:ParB family chromosome partitioning protein